MTPDRENVCNLSAGDFEMLGDGETVGPWLFDGKPVYVSLDEYERQKVESVEVDNEKKAMPDGGMAQVERQATVTVPADMSAEQVRDAIKLWRHLRDPEETVAECEQLGVFDDE